MSEKLLPCPHCGGTAKIEDPSHSPWIRCTGCGIRTAPYGWKQDAVSAWNRREMDHNVQECAENARWIPVTERLPENWEDVLVYYKSVNIGYIDPEEDWFVYGYGDVDEVTHWCELPEPPELYKDDSNE